VYVIKQTISRIGTIVITDNMDLFLTHKLFPLMATENRNIGREHRDFAAVGKLLFLDHFSTSLETSIE
jgi:hypothetical protein